MESSVPAIKAPYCCCCKPTSRFSPMGKVKRGLLCRIICGHRKLFYEPMKAIRQNAPIIGRVTGMTTSQ